MRAGKAGARVAGVTAAVGEAPVALGAAGDVSGLVAAAVGEGESPLPQATANRIIVAAPANSRTGSERNRRSDISNLSLQPTFPISRC